MRSSIQAHQNVPIGSGSSLGICGASRLTLSRLSVQLLPEHQTGSGSGSRRGVSDLLARRAGKGAQRIVADARRTVVGDEV